MAKPLLELHSGIEGDPPVPLQRLIYRGRPNRCDYHADGASAPCLRPGALCWVAGDRTYCRSAMTAMTVTGYKITGRPR